MFERLTSRHKIKYADGTERIETLCHGHRYGPAAFPSKYGTSEPQGYKEYCEMVDCLAAYEDSGLLPEEIKTAVMMYGENSKAVLDELQAYRSIGTVEELSALKQTKADGRLVVLPCKVGDTVYLTTHGWVEETKVRTLFFGHPSYSRGSPDPRYYRIRCENLDMPWDSIGKTVFLTREAAEKAIAEVGE